MSSEGNVTGTPPDSPPPSPRSGSPAAEWFARLGLGGKLLLFGAAAGVIATFLPLLSVSVNLGPFQGSQSAMVLDDWRGIVCLLGYLAAVALAVLLYPATRRPDRNVAWAAVGVGTMLVLLALWLLILAARSGSGVGLGDAGAARVSIGIGAILNLLTAGTVAAGAVIKAREERLI
jgi:hypothetical protein